MVDYATVLRSVSIIIPRIHAGQDVQASMHGGINGSEDSEHHYRVSLNAEEERNQPLLQ
jgi:hypothetical protein